MNAKSQRDVSAEVPGAGSRPMLDFSLSGELQDAMSTQPFIYVCCMSDFNLPELEACLMLRPQHLVLVVSTFKAAQDGVERFESVIRETLPDTQVHRPDRQQGFGGEDLLEFQRWVRSHLRPLLEQLDDDGQKPWKLNATGGTKSMSMTLLVSLPWSEVHYRGINTRTLQTMALLNNEWVSRGGPLDLKDPPASRVVQLYAYVAPAKLADPQRPDPDKRELAQQIWQGLKDGDEDLLALFGWLDEIWSQGRDNPAYNQNSLTLPLPESFTTSGAHSWIQRFAGLRPGMFQLASSDRLITIPGNKGNNNRIEKLKRWISGIWLEDLAYHWLSEAGLTDEQMIASLASSPELDNSSDTDRESDLFVHNKGYSSLIEIKADVPGADYRRVEDQINSFGDRLGRTRKILLIGPEFRATLEREPEKGHWPRFEKRLKASRITLCDSRETLLKALGVQ
jgi:hypothetical protein